MAFITLCQMRVSGAKANNKLYILEKPYKTRNCEFLKGASNELHIEGVTERVNIDYEYK